MQKKSCGCGCEYTNKGYVGKQRSIRSQKALESYEVPVSRITKALISEYLDVSECFSAEELEYLRSVSKSRWCFVAKVCSLPTSKHHTGEYYVLTPHYSLECVAFKIIALGGALDVAYKQYMQDEKKLKSEYNFVAAWKQVWEGTKKHPKLGRPERVVGVVVGDYIYTKPYGSIGVQTRRLKLRGKKLYDVCVYKSYEELEVENPDCVCFKSALAFLVEEKAWVH